MKRKKKYYWTLAPLGQNQEYHKTDRKYKVGSILSQMVFILPVTDSKEYDDFWFEFFSKEAERIAHMKKRKLGQYLRINFNKYWFKRVDKLVTETDDKKSLKSVFNTVSSYLESKNIIPEYLLPVYYKRFIDRLNLLFRKRYCDPTECPTSAKNSVLFWRDVRDLVIKMIDVDLAIINKERNKTDDNREKEE